MDHRQLAAMGMCQYDIRETNVCIHEPLDDLCNDDADTEHNEGLEEKRQRWTKRVAASADEREVAKNETLNMAIQKWS